MKIAIGLTITHTQPTASDGQSFHSSTGPARKMNSVSYFEIPVTDLDRAIRFYEAVFGYVLERASVDGNDMAFFPYAENRPGASGALVRGESYAPGRSGARIYFDVVGIQETLSKAVDAGGVVLYPETVVGAFGSVAEIEDSEGNCIGLHANHPPGSPEASPGRDRL